MSPSPAWRRIVAIQHQEPTDKLDVNGLGGNDAISAAALAAGAIALTLDGGAGTTRSPAAGASRPSSAATATTRATATEATTWRSWAPATTPSSGIRATAATPSRARPASTRCSSTAPTPASASTCPRTASGCASSATSRNITMDMNDVETVDFRALGGADTVTVNDLTGTDVQLVKIDLAGAPGGTTGDGQPDQVIVNGTNGNDAITVGGRNGTVGVAGLAARVTSPTPSPPTTRSTINALAGDDVARRLRAQVDSVVLTLDGGAGNDVLRRERRKRQAVRPRRRRRAPRRSRRGRPRRRPGQQHPDPELTASNARHRGSRGPRCRAPSSSRRLSEGAACAIPGSRRSVPHRGRRASADEAGRRPAVPPRRCPGG